MILLSVEFVAPYFISAVCPVLPKFTHNLFKFIKNQNLYSFRMNFFTSDMPVNLPCFLWSALIFDSLLLNSLGMNLIPPLLTLNKTVIILNWIFLLLYKLVYYTNSFIFISPQNTNTVDENNPMFNLSCT